MINDFSLNDIVKMKKQHACGFNEWQIIRVGADIKIRCLHCKRIVMLDREKFVMRATKIIKKHEA